MKVAVFLLLLGVASVAAFTEQDYSFLFYKYLAHHNKVYHYEEFGKRYDIFKANMDFVTRHNAEASQGLHSFTLSMNRFGDMTNEEYRSRFLGLRRNSPTGSQASGTFTRPASLTDLPSSVDWRDKGVVMSPKDQGQCGSCWAFSAVGAMEGAHALANGTLVSLSEQELVDCVNDGADTCSEGGEMHDGYLYAIQAGGMESEASYPYTATSTKVCKFDKTKVVATFSSYLNVTSGDESALQAAIATQPTVSIGIDASSIWFQLYSTGVFDLSSCKNAWADLDHGVLLVGYGTSSGKDYWLVKNSWGASWGQSGYIWMSRGKSNQCGVATDATYPLV